MNKTVKQTVVVNRIATLKAMQSYLTNQTHLCQGEVAISYHRDDSQYLRPILSASGQQGIAYTGIDPNDLSSNSRSGITQNKYPIIQQVFNQLPALPSPGYVGTAPWCNLITLWEKQLDSRDWVIAHWHINGSQVYASSADSASKQWLPSLYCLVL